MIHVINCDICDDQTDFAIEIAALPNTKLCAQCDEIAFYTLMNPSSTMRIMTILTYNLTKDRELVFQIKEEENG